MNHSIIAALLLVTLGGVSPQSTGRRILGRVNPRESQTIGEPVRGLPGVQRAARGNYVRLAIGLDSTEITAPIAADGSFEFRNIPPGTYQVTVLPNIAIPPYTLVVGADDVLDLQLGVPLVRVAGSVTVPSGGPRPRFQIEFLNPKTSQKILAHVGATFTADLPAGAYEASISGLPRGYAVASFAQGNVDLLRQTLDTSSSRIDTIQIALSTTTPPPWVKVTGRLTGIDGKPVSALRLSGPSLGEPVSAALKSDGSFEFPQLLPGAYEMQVLPSVVPFLTTLTVPSNDVNNVVIAFPDLRNVAGEFIRIEAGEFVMGCSLDDLQCDGNEKPQHRVGITRPFEIGKYEVTQAQWETIMGTNPSQFKGRDRPVENVNEWQTAQEYIQKLNALNDGYRYRLPTEAEWEYAARAGSTAWSASDLEAMAWHGGNSGGSTRPVGEKQPNAWGLYDTQGNVWEWVQDWYGPAYYSESPALDPQGPSTGPLHVLRGGSWAVPPSNARVSYRGNLRFGGPSYSYGLRLVRERAR